MPHLPIVLVRVAIRLALIGAATACLAAEVRYYPVPAGSQPHDVAAAPDGSVW